MDAKKYAANNVLLYVIVYMCMLTACATTGSDVSTASDQNAQPAEAESSYETGPVIQEEIAEESALNDIDVTRKDSGCTIALSTNTSPQYTVFKLSNPHRLIVDLLDLESSDIDPPLVIDNDIITTINATTMQDNEHSFMRVEIGLKHDCMYSAERRDTAVLIDVTDERDLQASGTTDKPTAAAPRERERLHKPSADQYCHITDISVLDEQQQSIISIVADSDMVSYNKFTMNNPARLVIDIPKAHKLLSQNNFRSQHGNIHEIRTGKKNGTVRLVVQFKSTDVPDYNIASANKTLQISIPAPGMKASPLKTAQSSIAEEKKQTAPDAKATPVPQPDQSEADTSDQKDTEPTISLNLKDAQIKNVLRLLADLSGKNMIISDSVTGLVTLKLDNIAWHEALDIILDTHGLGKIESKNITRIETRENIRRINEEKLMAQKSQEEVEELVIQTYEISYVDAEELEEYIDELEVLSKRGSVTSYEENNKLTVQDIASNISKITKIVEEQDTPTDQVMIEARIVQSVPSYTRELGIRWGGTYNTTHNNDAINLNGGAGNDYIVNLPAAAGEGAGGAINFGYIKDNLNLDVQLTALENEDKIKIISNPRILGLDNQMARIKQGVALPYLKLSEEGVTSTEFKDAVLELEVTPKITLEDTIRLEVFVTKNQKSAQTGAGNEPGIDVREVETSLLLGSGNTVVIGGIYETTNSVNIKKVPFFGDLPYLGNIFKSKKEEDQLVELLVFITVTVLEHPDKKTLASDTSNNAS